MMSLLEVHHTLDSVIDELLHSTEILHPPVNAFVVARHLGWEIILNAQQQERGRLKRFHDRATIFLKPDDRPERLQWALAHEIGESLSSRWAHWIEDPQFSDAAETREALANLFATRLLLPERWFREQVNATGRDLFALKEQFSTASYQLIAQRLLDLEEPLIVTVIDQGQPTSRNSNWLRSVPPLQEAERRCWRESHARNEPGSVRTEELDIACWPVHEPDWKREILLTAPVDVDLA